MMKFLRDILTSDAASSVYDLVRVCTFAATVVGLLLSIFAVGRGDKFDLIAFGAGYGAIIAAGGAAMWARRDREQEPPRGK